MQISIYGNYGKPLLVFPSSEGTHADYKNFGMIEACQAFIDDQKIKIYCVDSIDSDSWMNKESHPAERGRNHAAYDSYIVHEVVPFIYGNCNSDRIPIIASGCSLGAYHAANVFFKYPEIFDTAILLSGVYSLDFSVGDFIDENVYSNDPLKYLPNMTSADRLQKYRRNQLILCCGQGPWEDECLRDTYRLADVLEAKQIGHWLDIWGHDVAHEWIWWRKMMPYFLGQIRL